MTKYYFDEKNYENYEDEADVLLCRLACKLWKLQKSSDGRWFPQSETEESMTETRGHYWTSELHPTDVAAFFNGAMAHALKEELASRGLAIQIKRVGRLPVMVSAIGFTSQQLWIKETSAHDVESMALAYVLLNILDEEEKQYDRGKDDRN